MSLSQSASGVPDPQGYDDLEVQTLRTQYEVTASDKPDANDHIVVENATSFDPAGGLNRDEVAELAALYVNTYAYHAIGGSDPGYADHEYELSTEGDANHIIQGSTPEETDLNGTVVNRFWDSRSTDPGVLFTTQPHNQVSWEDTTNGLGGGGTGHMQHSFIPFRAWFGAGPTMDRHVDLNEHISVGWHNKTSGNTYMYTNKILYWNVFEE